MSFPIKIRDRFKVYLKPRSGYAGTNQLYHSQNLLNMDMANRPAHDGEVYTAMRITGSNGHKIIYGGGLMFRQQLFDFLKVERKEK